MLSYLLEGYVYSTLPFKGEESLVTSPVDREPRLTQVTLLQIVSIACILLDSVPYCVQVNETDVNPVKAAW